MSTFDIDQLRKIIRENSERNQLLQHKRRRAMLMGFLGTVAVLGVATGSWVLLQGDSATDRSGRAIVEIGEMTAPAITAENLAEARFGEGTSTETKTGTELPAEAPRLTEPLPEKPLAGTSVAGIKSAEEILAEMKGASELPAEPIAARPFPEKPLAGISSAETKSGEEMLAGTKPTPGLPPEVQIAAKPAAKVPTDHRTVAAIPAALTKPILAKSEPTGVVPAPGLQTPQAVQGAESSFSEASSTGKPPSGPPSAVAAVSETRKQAPAQSRPSLQPDLRRTSPESPLGKESARKYQIIFSSLPTEEAARVERDRLATLSSKPHGDPSVSIEKVDLGEGQVAYRVLASEVPTRETADDFCASVNMSGGDCLVIERQAR